MRVSGMQVLQHENTALALWRFVPMLGGEYLISNVAGEGNEFLCGFGQDEYSSNCVLCVLEDDIENKCIRWRFRRCHDTNAKYDAQGMEWENVSAASGGAGKSSGDGGDAAAIPAAPMLLAAAPTPAPAAPLVRPLRIAESGLPDGLYQLENTSSRQPLSAPAPPQGGSPRARVLVCAPTAPRDRVFCDYCFRLAFDARHDCYRIFAFKESLPTAVVRYEMPVFFDIRESSVRVSTRAQLRAGNDHLAHWQVIQVPCESGDRYLISTRACGDTLYLHGASGLTLRSNPDGRGALWIIRQCHSYHNDRDASGMKWM